MARLLYMAITSLDGYVADEKGDYNWAMPDDEVFGFVNDFERPVGTYLVRLELLDERRSGAGRLETGLRGRSNALEPGFHGVPSRPGQTRTVIRTVRGR
jgi:hypothetical protein